MSCCEGKWCGSKAELLDAYVDGELTPEQSHWIEGHLKQCAQCKQLAMNYLDTVAELRSKLRAAQVMSRTMEARSQAAVTGPLLDLLSSMRKAKSMDTFRAKFDKEQARQSGMRAKRAMSAARERSQPLVASMPPNEMGLASYDSIDPRDQGRS